MKTKTNFIAGFVLGVIITLAFCFFIVLKNMQFKYVQLKEDYKIEDVGTLKKGTILRIDEGMSEGFTRYILYLNLGDGDEVEIYEPKYPYLNLIIPYWLHKNDE